MTTGADTARIETAVQLRWSDFDGLGHVSHTAALTLLEVGRDAFLAEHGIRAADYVVASCTVDYVDEISAGERSVTVRCGVERIGSTSLTTDEALVDEHGRATLRARFTLVMWDRERRSSRPITDRERASLQRDLDGRSPDRRSPEHRSHDHRPPEETDR